METRPRLAVLIDAENLGQASHLPKIIEAIEAELGLAALKRAYGDFSNTRLKNWKKALAANAIQPFQQFPIVSAKNATDIALVIDCLDLLYSRRFDGFCLVTSDSDFSRLAGRIREDGIPAYGFGKAAAKSELQSAFDRFFPIETLGKKSNEKPSEAPSRRHATAAPPAKKGALSPAEFAAMKKEIEARAGEGGYASLGTLGKFMRANLPGVGFKSLKVFLKNDQRFVVGEGPHANMVRLA